MAVIPPRGIAMREETKVTAREAAIRGNMPKSGGSDVGYQLLPKRKSVTGTVLKIGIPWIKRKAMIRVRTRMEIQAVSRKKFLMQVSRNALGVFMRTL